MFSITTQINMINGTCKYLKRSYQAGAISGFTLGFSMCNVTDKPLIIERFVAGSLLGVIYSFTFPVMPLIVLHNLDKKIKGRSDGKIFDLWINMYTSTTTAPEGFRLYTKEEAYGKSRPFPLLTADELRLIDETDSKAFNKNKNINHSSISPLTYEELKEMREKINKKK